MTTFEIISLTFNVLVLVYLNHSLGYMLKLKKENEFLKADNARLKKNNKEIMSVKFNLK